MELKETFHMMSIAAVCFIIVKQLIFSRWTFSRVHPPPCFPSAIRNDDHSVLFFIRAEVTGGYTVLVGSSEKTDAIHAGAEISSLITCGTVGAN